MEEDTAHQISQIVDEALGGGQVIIQDAQREGEFPNGTMVVVEEGGSNVVYIVQQEGMETEGVTYEMLDENMARQISLQTVGEDNSVTTINEAELLNAVSSGQIQVVRAEEGQGSQSTLVTTDANTLLDGTMQVVDLPIDDKETDSGTKFIALHEINEFENIQYVYTCRYCDMSSGNLDELEEHILLEHEGVTEQAAVTDKSDKNIQIIQRSGKINQASSTSDLNEGMVLADVSNNFYKCPYCTKMFAIAWWKSLEQHIQEAHPGRPYRFPKMNEEKNYNCLLCDKSFLWMQSMIHHVKDLHSDCTAGDLEQFEELYGISAKKLTESDEPKFSCMLCDKVFKWPKSLKSHMLEFHGQATVQKKSQTNGDDVFYKCPYCELTTKYACSIRKHIERKHFEKLDFIDVRKLDIPRVTSDQVKTNIIKLDTRPPEVRLSDCKKIYRCPFCKYATQLPSNMARHITSRNHKGIVTNEELKKIKIRSFMVIKDRKSDKLPPLKFTPSLKALIDEKKRILGLEVNDDDVADCYVQVVDREMDEMDAQDEAREREQIYRRKMMDRNKEDRNKVDRNKETVEAVKELDKVNVKDELREDEQTEATIDVSDDLDDGGDVSVKKKSQNVPNEAEKNVKDIKGTGGSETDPSGEHDMENVNTGSNEVEVGNADELVGIQGTDNRTRLENKENRNVDDRVVSNIRSDSDKEVISCVVCQKLFQDANLLLQHAAAHENVMVEFACSHCPERFAFFSKFKEHSESHHADLAETVTPISTMALSIVGDSLRKAVTTYECPYCEMLFSQLSPLQQHISLDHEKFLTAIMMSVAGKNIINQYNCFFCELGFVSVRSLIQHMQLIHPNAKKPSDVDSWVDTPSRKSSRKRKLPKWLETDMDVEDEVTAKRKKVMEIPLRLANMKPKTPKVTYAKKIDPKVKPCTVNTPTVRPSIKKGKTPQKVDKSHKDPKEIIVIRNEKVDKAAESDKVSNNPDNAKETETGAEIVNEASAERENAASKEKEDTAIPEKPKPKVYRPIPRKKRTTLLDQLDSPVLPKHKCPHCDFTAKRSSALTFHINFNHQSIKIEPLDPDIDPANDEETLHEDDNLDDPDFKQPELDKNPNEQFEIAVQNVGETVNEVNLGNAVVYIYKDLNTGVKQMMEDGTQIHIVEAASLEDEEDIQQSVGHTCVYCGLSFPTKKAVKTHIRYNHRQVIEEVTNLKEILNVEEAFKCPVCPVVSNSVDRILLHVEVAHPMDLLLGVEDVPTQALDGSTTPVKFLCPFCPFKSKWKAAIPRHVEKYHPTAKETYDQKLITCEPDIPTDSFLCPYCQGVMESKVKVIEHVQKQHGSQPALNEEDVESATPAGDADDLIKCPYCEMHSRHMTNIEQHVARMHENKVDEFDRKKLKTSDSAKMYRCKYCAIESKHYSSFQQHMARQHPQEEFQISEPTVEDSAYYKCIYCHELFKTKGAVIVHSRHNHKGKPVPKSSEILSIPSELEIADNTFSYKCSVCDMEGKSQVKLLNHMNETHAENLDYGATGLNDIVGKHAVNSDYDSSDLNIVFKAKKQNRRLFGCKICNERLPTLSHLIQHFRVLHTKSNPGYNVTTPHLMEDMTNMYNCPCCSYTSDWRRMVVSHFKTVHPEMISASVHPEMISASLSVIKCSFKAISNAQSSQVLYECPYCGLKYSWKKSVSRHIRLYHAEYPDVEPLEVKSSSNSASRKGTKQMKCRLCKNQRFKTVPQLRSHFKAHHPQHVNNCLSPKHVEYIYTSLPAGLLKSGGGIDDGKEQFQCVLCRSIYQWKKSLYVHVRNHHPEHKEVYQVLDKMVDLIADSMGDTMISSETVTNLQYKSIAGTVKKTLKKCKKKCGLCNAVKRSAWAVRAHYCLKHGQSSRKPIHRQGITVHQKTCSICAISFFSTKTLLRHHILQHRNKPLQHLCGNCGWGYTTQRSLLTHQVTCLGRGKMKRCMEMGCTFSTKFVGRLQYHLRKQHGRRTITKNNKLLCEICSRSIGNRQELRQHMAEHQRNRICSASKCEICRRQFDSVDLKRAHMTEKHGHLMEICDICGEILFTKQQLQAHRRKHSNKPLVKCSVCDLMLPHGSSLSHMATKHPDLVTCNCDICQGTDPNATFRCTICCMNFCQRFKLMSHNQVVHGSQKPQGKNKRSYECRVCKQVFFTLRALHVHVGQSHNMKDLLPNQDNLTKITSSTDVTENSTHVIHIGQGETTQYLPKLTEAGLNAVIKELILYENNSDLPYKCILCGRCFGKSKYIKLHIRRSHVKDENQPYRCKVCSSGFVRLTEFRKHTRSHSDFRPYKCKFCSKAFKQQANLKEHYFVHSDTKQYQCMICHRTFRQRGALTSHVVGHDVLKPFKCMFCDKGFTTRGELTRHMKKYDRESAGNKFYSCHMCFEKFSHFPLLMKHIDQHNPEKPFHCQVCLETFSNFVTLYFHKLKHGHLLESEVFPVEEEQSIEESTPISVRKVKRDAKRLRNQVKVEGQGSNEGEVFDEQPVYLNSTDEVNLLQNPEESTIEVIIEDIDQNAVVKTSGVQPEHDELLSIAQQLTELSSIAEKGSILKEEDEIVKNMLDADAEVLATLNRQVNQNQRWDRTNYETTISVQDYLRDSQTERPTEEGIQFDQVNAEDAHATVPIDIPTVSDESSVATNIEELAQLIAQNSEEGEQSNVLAYQNEDGSVIYVCLPAKDGDANEENAVLENRIVAKEETMEVDEAQEAINAVEEIENATKSEIIYTEVPNEFYDQSGTNIVQTNDNSDTDITFVQEATEEYVSEVINSGGQEIRMVENAYEVIPENSEKVDTHMENGGEVVDMQDEQANHSSEEVDAKPGKMDSKVENVPEVENIPKIENVPKVENVPDIDENVPEFAETVPEPNENIPQFEIVMDPCPIVPKHAKAMPETDTDHPESNDDVPIDNEEVGFVEAGDQIEDQVMEVKMAGPEMISAEQTVQADGTGQREIVDYKEENKVVEYDARTFIREEFLDVDFQQTLELTEMDGNYKYVFVKDGKYFTCIHCNSRISVNNLRSHMKRHVPEKSRQFECDYCNKKFITGNELKRHVKIHKGEKDHVCSYCGKGFVQSGQLAEHVRIHTGEKPYRCQDCDAAFATSTQCRQHWRRIHGDNIYPCNQCERGFKSIPDLTRHKGQAHSGVGKKAKTTEVEDEPVERGEHVCHICGEAYSKLEALMSHMYKHAMENVEFKCNKCEKTFRSKESLTSHKRAKHEGNEYICNHCGEVFQWRKSYTRHLQIKHGEGEEGKSKEEFKCKICEKQLANQASLNYHMGSKHVE